MADSYTGGSFLNIVGEMRPEAVMCGKLGQAERTSAGTRSVLSQVDSNNSWHSSYGSNFRQKSFGNVAPSGDGRLNSLGQPITYLGHDDVIRPSTYNTWDSLWRENFLDFMRPNLETVNKEDVISIRSQHRQHGKANHNTCHNTKGAKTAPKIISKNKQKKDNRSPSKIHSLSSSKKRQQQNDVSSDQASQSGKVTPSNCLGTRSLFQTSPVIHIRHGTGKTRPPTSVVPQRRAPPLSRDTIVVGSPFRTEEQHGSYK